MVLRYDLLDAVAVRIGYGTGEKHGQPMRGQVKSGVCQEDGYILQL
jgi:hypothetical protein